jgi:hypothetical protein
VRSPSFGASPTADFGKPPVLEPKMRNELRPSADRSELYYRWLGIPVREQPPNHYRLLGLALFEHDPDVIESAADRQMAHIRSQASGPHAAESQQILNEIAAAKVCLLNEKRKAEYDAQLRSKLAMERPSVGVAPAAEAEAIPVRPIASRRPKRPVVPTTPAKPFVCFRQACATQDFFARRAGRRPAEWRDGRPRRRFSLAARARQ